ncbi:Dabb family protein [Yoonia sp.]|uniref:Dabb family protein n=1 Tax=Yoonia sp. TaxID=2212373 RepID=UPI00237567D3|nr:Dabb family protein [Yoonia sp.]MDB4111625.1 Dabb family protein [Yoonia sp.]
MIRHIVFIRFKPEISDAGIAAIFDELYAIKDKLPGVLSITSGKSESPEQMERGYMHGFVVDFVDWDALQAYQDHPDHKLLGGKLVANAVAGIDDILVFDLPVND